MIRAIVHDPDFLKLPSSDAVESDLNIAFDLMDTLRENADRCVGMAANMIGITKRIIAVNDNGDNVLMLNPVLLRKSGPYITSEGCLSLPGERTCERYKLIRVEYTDIHLKRVIRSYSGFIAQIIQHEMDHLNGILI